MSRLCACEKASPLPPVAAPVPRPQSAISDVQRSGKKRFEVVCYSNKITDFREEKDLDLDNVLQVPGTIFFNASRGLVAPNDDLRKAFGPTATKDEMILEILKKGECQIGSKERSAQLDRVHHEVIDIVAGKLVDPKSGRVYTTGIIEKALDQLSSQGGHAVQEKPGKDKDENMDTQDDESAQPDAASITKPSWTGVTTTKSAKSQALDAMKALIAHQPIPIARARMRLRITCPTAVLKQTVKATTAKQAGDEDDAQADGTEKAKTTVKDRILSYVEQIENQDVAGDEWEVVGAVEPGSFKPLTEFVGTQTKGRARVVVLDMAVVHDGD